MVVLRAGLAVSRPEFVAADSFANKRQCQHRLKWELRRRVCCHSSMYARGHVSLRSNRRLVLRPEWLPFYKDLPNTVTARAQSTLLLCETLKIQ